MDIEERVKKIDTKEAIKVFKETIKITKQKNLFKLMDSELAFYKRVIELLQRGEKYYKILKEIEYNLDWHKPDSPFSTPDGELIDEIFELINNITRRYFPK